MRVSEKHPGKYMKAADLKGRVVHVQISHVEEDVPVGQDQEPKDVLHFKGSWLPLILNVTNKLKLAALLGDDSDDWDDGDVVLYAVETTTGPGVRIQQYRAEPEAAAPKKKAAKPTTPFGFDELNPPPHEGEDLIDGDVDDLGLDIPFAR